MKLFKNPKTRKRDVIMVILPLFILMCVFGFISFRSLSSTVSNASGASTDDKDTIESMDYHLRKNATDLQVELFKELKADVKDGSDPQKIAADVAKNFVADFYTWTNKAGNYDVGGTYYIYGSSRNNFYVQARNSYYQYLTYYINNFGSENLLEVDSIETSDVSNKIDYTYNGNTYDSYYLRVMWTYKNEDTFKDIKVETDVDSGFVTTLNVLVINNDGRYEIVQAYGDN